MYPHFIQTCTMSSFAPLHVDSSFSVTPTQAYSRETYYPTSFKEHLRLLELQVRFTEAQARRVEAEVTLNLPRPTYCTLPGVFDSPVVFDLEAPV